MKLLTLIALAMMSLGVSAQTRFDTQSYQKMEQERMRESYERAQARKAKDFKLITKDHFSEQGAIYDLTLTIKGNSEDNEAKVSVSIRKSSGSNHRSGASYVSTDYFSSKVKANSLEEVKELISHGLTLESQGVFDKIGLTETRKATLSSQGNVDQIDFDSWISASFDI